MPNPQTNSMGIGQGWNTHEYPKMDHSFSQITGFSHQCCKSPTSPKGHWVENFEPFEGWTSRPQWHLHSMVRTRPCLDVIAVWVLELPTPGVVRRDSMKTMISYAGLSRAILQIAANGNFKFCVWPCLALETRSFLCSCFDLALLTKTRFSGLIS